MLHINDSSFHTVHVTNLHAHTYIIMYKYINQSKYVSCKLLQNYKFMYQIYNKNMTGETSGLPAYKFLPSF